MLNLLPSHLLQICTLEYVLLPQRKQAFTLLFFIKNLCIAQYCESFTGFLWQGSSLPTFRNAHSIFFLLYLTSI